jgi:hypothetical protein
MLDEGDMTAVISFVESIRIDNTNLSSEQAIEKVLSVIQ